MRTWRWHLSACVLCAVLLLLKQTLDNITYCHIPGGETLEASSLGHSSRDNIMAAAFAAERQQDSFENDDTRSETRLHDNYDDIEDTFTLRQDVCRGRNLTLVICVPVRRSGRLRRDSIRATWGSYGFRGHNASKPSIALLFFIGAGNVNESEDVQKNITEEFRQFGDIVQDSYVDSYKNLSLKSLSIVRWAAKFCRGDTSYILKADDDMYINIPLLVSLLRNTSSLRPWKPPFLLGHVSVERKPHRRPNSYWYTSLEVYPDKFYPPYVGGASYAMTSSAAAGIARAARGVHVFWLEDVYVTGMCSRLAGVELVHDDRFFWRKRNASVFQDQVSAGDFSVQDQHQVHEEVLAMTSQRKYVDAL